MNTIPTILTNDADVAIERLALLDQNNIDEVQIDVLDNTLFPFSSWHDAHEFSISDFSLNVILHVMTQDPAQIMHEWKAVKNVRRMLWHIEAPVDHKLFIKTCRKQKIETGLALAPETPASALAPYASLIDEALILGVHPGQNGQTLLPGMIEKAAEAHALFPKLAIGFDGGVQPSHMKKLTSAGVSRLYKGIFAKKDPIAYFQKFLPHGND